MTIEEALELIGEPDFPRTEQSSPLRWADLGCGSGLFTRALARQLPAGSTVYGVDRQPSLRRQALPNGVDIVPVGLDFVSHPLGLQELDGILMANSLHYVADKNTLIRRLQQNMRPAASFLIVEYDTDRPVPVWVPYPVSYAVLQNVFRRAGYGSIRKLGERPSAYGRSNLYAARIGI